VLECHLGVLLRPVFEGCIDESWRNRWKNAL
jgi:hypothetical protein